MRCAALVWFKVTGMLNQNWALVVEPGQVKTSAQAVARILFFDDHDVVFDELRYANDLACDFSSRSDCSNEGNQQPGQRHHQSTTRGTSC